MLQSLPDINKMNDEVINKRKLIKYLDDKELRFKGEAPYLFYHINMLKDIYDGVNGIIIQVQEKDKDNESTNLLDIEYCIEYSNDLYHEEL